ncbi:MAG TPA: BatD family protein [Chitinophagaceae bacterium]|nr:BatD family protein [Chitinophagaceae bacterium]
MDRKCKIGVWMISLVLFVAPGLRAQFRFTTQVSSTKVDVGDPFQVNFVLENATQLSGFQPPAFTGFDVLQSSQGSSISDDNGQVSETITYSYLLRGKSLGSFTIDGATARESGNKVESNPVTIDVEKASATASAAGSPSSSGGWMATPGGGSSLGNTSDKKSGNAMDLIRKNLFAKVSVDKTTVYQGQQLTATYKLYTRLSVSSQVTKVPAFTGFSSHDIRIPNPVPSTVERFNGVPYNVFLIRKTMLFPLQSGTLELDPVEIHNTVRLYQAHQAGGGKDPFGDLFSDPFFKDPFGNDPFGNATSYQDFDYDASSTPVEITVKPLPTAGQPAAFNGAVGDFTLTSGLDKSNLTTDDAATLRLTVSGSGNIDMISAPKPDFPASLDAYDPKVTDHFNKNSNPFSGTRTFEYVLMPKIAGDYTIPPVTFSYFDPDAKIYKTLTTQPYHLQVTQGIGETQQAPSSLSNTGGLAPLLYTPGRWIRGNTLLLTTWWIWLLTALPVLILIALLVLRKKMQQLRSDTVLFRHRRANKVALKRLEVAAKYLRSREDKAFYEETSRAVWGYLSHKLDIPYASLSRDKAAEAIEASGMKGAPAEKLFSLLDECQVALYSPHGGQAKMKQAYQSALEIIGELEDHLK